MLGRMQCLGGEEAELTCRWMCCIGWNSTNLDLFISERMLSTRHKRHVALQWFSWPGLNWRQSPCEFVAAISICSVSDVRLSAVKVGLVRCRSLWLFQMFAGTTWLNRLDLAGHTVIPDILRYELHVPIVKTLPTLHSAHSGREPLFERCFFRRGAETEEEISPAVA